MSLENALAEHIVSEKAAAGYESEESPMVLVWAAAYVFIDSDGTRRMGWDCADDARMWEVKGLLHQLLSELSERENRLSLTNVLDQVGLIALVEDDDDEDDSD